VTTSVRISRVYDPPGPEDGYRVLVDRLWPRGVSKEAAGVGEWCRDVGPSNELRRWFGHEPDRFEEFATRYRAELAHNPALRHLQDLTAEHPVITLVYSAKDRQHNQAVVLRDVLRGGTR
jgi:DNA-3-methyladenine glycosylase